MPRWLNLPTLLTLLRLLLTPVVVVAILRRQATAALAVFIFAAVTDVLDGAVARRWRQVTPSGAYLDPVADKCLLTGVFLALALGGFVPWWFACIVFGRDLFILSGVAVFYLFTPIRKFPPSVWGKISTFIQIDTAVVWMARNMLENSQLNALATVMLWVCAAFTLWSGIHYAWRGVQVARAH